MLYQLPLDSHSHVHSAFFFLFLLKIKKLFKTLCSHTLHVPPLKPGLPEGSEQGRFGAYRPVGSLQILSLNTEKASTLNTCITTQVQKAGRFFCMGTEYFGSSIKFQKSVKSDFLDQVCGCAAVSLCSGKEQTPTADTPARPWGDHPGNELAAWRVVAREPGFSEGGGKWEQTLIA